MSRISSQGRCWESSCFPSHVNAILSFLWIRIWSFISTSISVVLFNQRYCQSVNGLELTWTAFIGTSMQVYSLWVFLIFHPSLSLAISLYIFACLYLVCDDFAVLLSSFISFLYQTFWSITRTSAVSHFSPHLHQSLPVLNTFHSSMSLQIFFLMLLKPFFFFSLTHIPLIMICSIKRTDAAECWRYSESFITLFLAPTSAPVSCS